MVVGGCVGAGHVPSYEDDDEDNQYELPITMTSAHHLAANLSTVELGGGRKQAIGAKRKMSLPTAQPIQQQQPQITIQQQQLQQTQESSTFIYMMTMLLAMGGFLFGYDTGIVSGAMVFVKRSFRLNNLWQEVVVTVTILGAWLLSLAAGTLSDRYGRKTVILWASMTFMIGSAAMAVAWSKYILMFGRLIVGMAIGLSSSVIPMYIAEVAPNRLRGSLVTLNICFITIGQLSAAITAGAFSYDQENGWRWMLGLAAVPALIQFVGFIFMPESPRWLVRHQRLDEALKSLKIIRGKSNPKVMREFERMRSGQVELVAQEERRREQKRNILVAIFRKTATRRALIVGCLLMATQQLAGINTVMYYTATIIEMSGVQSQSIAVWLAVPTAAVFVIFSFCGYLLADRLSRRTLTLVSLMGVILSLMVLATGFHLTSMKGAVVTHHNMSGPEVCFSRRDCASCTADTRCGFCYDAKNLAVASCLERSPEDATRSAGGECHSLAAVGPPTNPHSSNFIFATHICPSMNQGIGLNTWLVLAGLVMYLAFFAPGLSPMPWAINSEIYPMWAGSFCYSLATSVNWLFNMLVSFTFLTLTELLTRHGVFYLYAIIASICWLALFWLLPETRGRSLDDISSLFARSSNSSSSSSSNSKKQLTNDQQDMMEGATRGDGGLQRHQQQVVVAQGNNCNLAFAPSSVGADSFYQVAKGSSSSLEKDELEDQLLKRQQHRQPCLDRNRSFKLGGPLAKATSMAISQPDLRLHLPAGAQRHQHQHRQLGAAVSPLPPPLIVSENNQQSSKRKYSDGCR